MYLAIFAQVLNDYGPLKPDVVAALDAKTQPLPIIVDRPAAILESRRSDVPVSPASPGHETVVSQTGENRLVEAFSEGSTGELPEVPELEPDDCRPFHVEEKIALLDQAIPPLPDSPEDYAEQQRYGPPRPDMTLVMGGLSRTQKLRLIDETRIMPRDTGR